MPQVEHESADKATRDQRGSLNAGCSWPTNYFDIWPRYLVVSCGLNICK
jgi:hypothetical protein